MSAMNALVKTLIALGLVLPLGAYVAGSLAAVGADDPRPHDTIVIRDSPTRSASPDVRPSPSARSTPDDHGRPEVVTPSVHDLGDDHGGDRGGHGGHGSTGGGHDSSGGGHGSDDSGGGGHG
ncbi:hypothetical protein [Nocardioides ungokensis]